MDDYWNVTGELNAYIWLLIGVLVLAYIIYHNVKMQRITNKVIEMIDQSKAFCNEIAQKAKTSDEETKQLLITQLENETNKFAKIKKDKKYPQQGPRIDRHIREIRSCIALIKDYERIEE
ncbi:MAG: hypothetical protein ACI4WG_02180 [Erysipelotrichaceae bacterium]